jgi:hypothetical protein
MTENAADEGGRTAPIPCPFVYAKGRICTGHVVSVEAYHADLTWTADGSGAWGFSFAPRTHYHLFCSEKGSHGGVKREDALKFWFSELPPAIQQIVKAR